MSKLKNYEKQRYSGNENGWHEPIESIGVTAITEAVATELNSQFRNTGVKYVETDNKPKDAAENAVDEAKEVKGSEAKTDLADADPADISNGDIAVLSDQTTKETIKDTDGNGRIEGDNKPPALIVHPDNNKSL